MQIYPQSQIHLAKAPKSPDDISGLRLMVVARTGADVMTRLGAAPISLMLPELYQGLQRNTVDGALMSWTAFQPFKLAEVTTYHIDTQLGTPPAMVFMAKKRYEALSPEARKLIDQNSGEAESRALGKAWDEVEEEARQAAKKDPKHTVSDPLGRADREMAGGGGAGHRCLGQGDAGRRQGARRFPRDLSEGESRSVNQVAEHGIRKTPPLRLDQRVIGAAPRQ